MSVLLCSQARLRVIYRHNAEGDNVLYCYCCWCVAVLPRLDLTYCTAARCLQHQQPNRRFSLRKYFTAVRVHQRQTQWAPPFSPAIMLLQRLNFVAARSAARAFLRGNSWRACGALGRKRSSCTKRASFSCASNSWWYPGRLVRDKGPLPPPGAYDVKSILEGGRWRTHAWEHHGGCCSRALSDEPWN